MIPLLKTLTLCLLILGFPGVARIVEAADYTPGKFHNYTHASGAVAKDDYQYSVYVPKDYNPEKSYPLVVYLHGGGKGRHHPDQGKRNMVAGRLFDNKRVTDAGYSRNAPGYSGYILVSPVKPVAKWNAAVFKRLLAHVKGKVSVDENRVYVTGFSMGGQGTWIVACGNDGSYKIAAMMPLGAWGCRQVRRGTTPEACKTLKTPVWVLHCPLDNVSRISEQLPLFQSHLDCGGYGRFTMIPGRGHISRPRGDDNEYFSMRMAWMLSQTYGTPFNYVLKVNNGKIVKVASGKRPFTGDTSGYGFYEPSTVVELTAAGERDGKPFIKWASDLGSFAQPSSRSTQFTVPAGDVTISAIYGKQQYKLTVHGGTAQPSSPRSGQLVTVTTTNEDFLYWTTERKVLELPNPTLRSIRFAMPAHELTLDALGKIHP
jgi:dienelactone hydrolase